MTPPPPDSPADAPAGPPSDALGDSPTTPPTAVTDDGCMAAVLQAVPSYQAQWDEHRAAHTDEAPDLLLDLVDLAAHAHVLLARADVAALRPLFTLMEALASTGTPEVQHAVRAGFLEALVDPLGDPVGASNDTDTEWAVLTTLLGPACAAHVQQVLRLRRADAPPRTLH